MIYLQIWIQFTNTFRYFAQYSTTIADIAHSVGAKVYMDKIYKKVGGLSSEGVGLMLLKEQNQKHNIKQMKNAYSATCGKKWGKRTNVSTTNRPSCGLGSPDIIGTKYDISCDVCQNMEMCKFKKKR